MPNRLAIGVHRVWRLTGLEQVRELTIAEQKGLVSGLHCAVSRFGVRGFTRSPARHLGYRPLAARTQHLAQEGDGHVFRMWNAMARGPGGVQARRITPDSIRW